MLEKFNKIKEKSEFYAQVQALTGKSNSTITTRWFNKETGFRIPDEYHKIVNHILDHRIKYEKAVEEFKNKYPKI